MVNYNPRFVERQIGAWVDRQLHDEFAILAKERGTTKAGLCRQLIENEVLSALRSTSGNGDAEINSGNRS